MTPPTLARALAAAALLAAGAAAGQDYPNRRITFVVPVSAGTPVDALARVLAQRLSASERLGRPVVIEDMPGARSFVGYDRVAKALPDGHTILLAGQQLALPRELTPDDDFDPQELAPIGRVATSPFVVAVPGRAALWTLADLSAFARRNPDSVNYGVVPNTAMQLDLLRLGYLMKAPMTEVPYKRATSLVVALLGDQIHMSFVTGSSLPFLRAGKLRALAVTGRTRWQLLPDVPSLGELGIDFESGFWYGIAVPAATPQAIRNRLTRELAEVMRMDEVRQAVARLGMDAVDPSPAEMIQHMQRERARADAGLKLLRARVDPEPSRASRERRSGRRDELGHP
jgi:tripartite-type tricarboxylate transporter receptor subunit TctC